jgi:hypothetical protein
MSISYARYYLLKKLNYSIYITYILFHNKNYCIHLRIYDVAKLSPVAIQVNSAVQQRYWRNRALPAGQSLRLSRNTPCSPNKFQNHHGALSRSGVPQAFSATAFSIFTPIALQSWTKSLIVQWWILGVSYQL